MTTLDDVCRRAQTLPCSPALLPRLIALLERHDTELGELAQLIQVDPALAAATVRMANSAYFGAANPATTVAEAVLRLGVRELYRLAALSLTARWMEIEVDGYRWEAGDFCRASLIKAVAADELARRTGAVDPDLAYTCGLVHEIGKLALAFSCGSSFPAIRARRTALGGTWLEAETDVLGFNHAAVSARLLAEWRFPAACVVVAAHNPPDAAIPVEYRALAAHVHAAQHLAASFGAGQGEDAFLYTLDSALLDEHGLGATVLEAALPDILGRASRLLHEKLSTGRIVF